MATALPCDAPTTEGWSLGHHLSWGDQAARISLNNLNTLTDPPAPQAWLIGLGTLTSNPLTRIMLTTFKQRSAQLNRCINQLPNVPRTLVVHTFKGSLLLAVLGLGLALLIPDPVTKAVCLQTVAPSGIARLPLRLLRVFAGLPRHAV